MRVIVTSNGYDQAARVVTHENIGEVSLVNGLTSTEAFYLSAGDQPTLLLSTDSFDSVLLAPDDYISTDAEAGV